MKFLKEICGECGYTFGSHSASYGSTEMNRCPATEDGCDYEQGPGTYFKPTGTYKDESIKDTADSCSNSGSIK